VVVASNPFLGRFQHSLDDKGRVILPAKWRSHLEGGAVVAEWMDGCLAVFPLAEFDRVADEVSAKAKRGDNERLAMRSFFSGANDVVPDKQGRIALAQSSREYAHLGAEVVLSGVGKRIEIWNVELFEGKEGEGKAVLHSADGIADFV
jgi:MraZ protein